MTGPTTDADAAVHVGLDRRCRSAHPHGPLRCCEREGYEITGGGRRPPGSAVELAEPHKPDLVIMDARCRADGIDAASEIKTYCPDRGTAFSQRDLSNVQRDAGGDGIPGKSSSASATLIRD